MAFQANSARCRCTQKAVSCPRLPARRRSARRLRLHQQRRRQGAQSRSAGQDVRLRRRAAQQPAPTRTRPRSSRTSTAITPTRPRRAAPSSWRPTPTTRPASIRRPSPRPSATRRCIPAPRTRRSRTTSSPRPTSTTSRIPRATRPPPARRWPSSRCCVQRYPDSPYTKQADNRIRIAEDLLAASEMNVGRYYQNRNNLRGRHQPLQDGGDRVPDDAAGRGGALPPRRDQHGARHRHRGPDRRGRARPQLSRTRSGTRTPTRC